MNTISKKVEYTNKKGRVFSHKKGNHPDWCPSHLGGHKHSFDLDSYQPHPICRYCGYKDTTRIG